MAARLALLRQRAGIERAAAGAVGEHLARAAAARQQDAAAWGVRREEDAQAKEAQTEVGGAGGAGEGRPAARPGVLGAAAAGCRREREGAPRPGLAARGRQAFTPARLAAAPPRAWLTHRPCPAPAARRCARCASGTRCGSRTWRRGWQRSGSSRLGLEGRGRRAALEFVAGRRKRARALALNQGPVCKGRRGGVWGPAPAGRRPRARTRAAGAPRRAGAGGGRGGGGRRAAQGAAAGGGAEDPGRVAGLQGRWAPALGRGLLGWGLEYWGFGGPCSQRRWLWGAQQRGLGGAAPHACHLRCPRARQARRPAQGTKKGGGRKATASGKR
jgi:hypothetical protein